MKTIWLRAQERLSQNESFHVEEKDDILNRYLSIRIRPVQPQKSGPVGGGNARAVAEYVLQALLLLCQAGNRSPRGSTAAVVGLGNVGHRVADWLTEMGMSVRACDPPLAEQGYEGPYELEPLDAVLDAD
ncbi:MAG: hypothetical protein GY950_04655, partial [bacterium]|nr:hypothetical protein [bacterium]